jgi:hypothetical protein
MQAADNHVRNAETSTQAADGNTGMRTWVLTLAISGTVLATMYGLAYWNEARSEAVRAQTISAPVAGSQ